MSTQPNPFKVGVFVLVALALGAASVVALGAGVLRSEPFRAETYLDESVHGLDVGSPVKYRGKQIGAVSEIGFVRQEQRYTARPDAPSPQEFGRYVIVRMEFGETPFLASFRREDRASLVAREVELGLRARLATAGITGLAYIEVDYVDPARDAPLAVPWTPRTAYVPSAPSTITRFVESVDKVFRRLENTDLARLADDLDTFLRALTSAVGDAQMARFADEVAALVRELRDTAAAARARIEGPEIDRILASSVETAASVEAIAKRAEAEFPRALANLNETTDSFRRTALEVEHLLSKDELDRAIESLAGTSESVRLASAELPDTLRSLRVTLQRLDLALSGGPADAGRTMANLRRITDNLRDLTEVARVYPSLVLFGDPPAALPAR